MGDPLVEAIEKAGYTGKIKISMNPAASEFYNKDTKIYDLDFKTETWVTGKELMNLYKDYCSKYPIVSIEDPFDENDFDSYALMTKDMGEDIQIVGDDNLVTNMKRIALSFEKGACNALLLKMNQIGSVTEAIDACKM